MRQLRRVYQYGVIQTARICARLLKLIGHNTQDIIELLWMFRIALGHIDPEGFVVEAQGARFRIRSADLMNLKIALIGAHEFEVTDFIERHLLPGTKGAFIDVGANIGYYSVIVGARLADVPVVAIEPSPSNVLQLRDNLALNGLDRIRVVEKAAWHESGTLCDLHVRDPYNLGANTVLGAGPVECTVETTTVDEVVAALGVASIEIVKIDVEGAEHEVLCGMRASLSDIRPRYVVCAFDHPEEAKRRETWGLLASQSYQEIDFDSELPVTRTSCPRATMLFRAAANRG